MLNELADLDAVVGMEWSWEDGRRRFIAGPRRRHQRSAEWRCAQLREDFYQALVLTEAPPLPKVVKELEKLRGEVKKLREVVDRATR
ncbi:MAG: hypothetical protein M3153_11360 [Chloroflexota bacterium]|nr:hypothetical protein [Chloroflexota bacterium]